MDGENLCDQYLEDDIFSILEALETQGSFEFQNKGYINSPLTSALILDQSETEASSPKSKRQKLNEEEEEEEEEEEGHPKMSHITVERNRRKQMNEHLSVLRSMMPCFYVKRGDQASIIGGVINYINELQQLVQSLESKKQRKSYSHDIVSSPRRLVSSPHPSPLSPRKPPLSPRLSLPVSPRTPQPYKPPLPSYLSSPSLPSPVPLSPCNSSTNSSINDTVNELVATSRSPIAQVEVKFCGPNLLLKTVSHRIPGQVVKIISALQQLPLQILQVNINKLDERMLNSFTIKIGIECQLSAEELAQQIQQTFC